MNWIRKIKQWLKEFDEGKAFQLFQVIRQGAGILTAILLAQIGLSKTQIGNYELLWYVGNTVSFFWVAGLIQALLTYFPGFPKGRQPNLIFSVYVSFLALAVGLVSIMWLFQKPLLLFFTDKPFLEHFPLFLIYILFNWPTYLLENFFLLQRKPWPILYFAIFSFLGQVLAIILPLFWGYTLRESFLALILLAIFKHIWLLAYVWKSSKGQMEWEALREWFILAIPLIGYALLGGLNLAFDQWIVNFTFNGDTEVFATFRYGARELPLALALATAFSTAMLPDVAADLQKGLALIKQRSRRLFHILFNVSIVLMLTSKWFFPLVFTEAFKDSVIIFNIYLLIVISRLIFSRTILMGLKDNTIVFWISVIELIFNILLSFVLIKYFGLAGTAIATTLAYTLEKVLISMYLYYKYKIPLSAYTDLKWFVGYSVILVLVFLFFGL